MEKFPADPAGAHSPGELHNRIEAMKLAYADVKAYDGDPRFGKIPVEQLLSKDYAAKRAELIDPEHANCTVAPGALGKSDTTLMVVTRACGVNSICHVPVTFLTNFGNTGVMQGAVPQRPSSLRQAQGRL